MKEVIKYRSEIFNFARGELVTLEVNGLHVKVVANMDGWAISLHADGLKERFESPNWQTEKDRK